MQLLVFSSSNSTWIWNTSSSCNFHASRWLIILPSTYQNPVYWPFLSGTREHFNSVTQSGMGIQFWCLFSLTFSVYFVYNSNQVFWGSIFDDFNLLMRIPLRKWLCLLARQVFYSQNIYSISLDNCTNIVAELNKYNN